ncbi:MAG: DUF4851 domain-containing protein [Deltaproteobacteria bacterium]|jgi:hypothetical protein|nr:DUF4851 domain-containing protein [Deltaproteobacteria bacterium]
MTHGSRFFLGAILGLFALSACTASYSGIDGDTMYSSNILDVAVIPQTGLQVLQSGSLLTEMEAIDNPTAGVHTQIRYAIYGDAGKVPLQRHAHVIFAEISDRAGYMFSPETFSRDKDFSLKTISIGGRDWNEHLLYEDNSADWFTRTLGLNGLNPPKTWIGKRWSRTVNNGLRIIVEYREPLPECASVQQNEIFRIFQGVTLDAPTPECKSSVEELFSRADQAFKIQRPGRLALSDKRPANILLQKSSSRLNATQIIGTARTVDQPMD